MNLQECQYCKKNNVEISDSGHWEKIFCKDCSEFRIFNKETEERYDSPNYIDTKIIEEGKRFEKLKTELQIIQKNLDSILEEIGEKDDRITRGIVIPGNISEQEIREYLKNYFDVSDEELLNTENSERLELESKRAIQERRVLECEKIIRNLEKKQMNSIDVSHKFKKESIEDKIELEKMKKQFEWFSELELKLRKCIRKALINEKSWWEKLVPISIQNDVRFFNHNDVDLEKLVETQNLDLLNKMTFKHLQMIITGQPREAPNWSYFEKIFPDYFYVNTRLRECNSLRNKGPYHTNVLDEKKERTLKNNVEELLGYIEPFLSND